MSMNEGSGDISSRDALSERVSPHDPDRRRWLTGMLAGPAIVSLPSQASALAFSSAARCLNSTYSTEIPLHVGIQDQWARQECTGITYATPNGRDSVALVRYGYDLRDEFWRIWPENAKGDQAFDPDTGQMYKIGTSVPRLKLVFLELQDSTQLLTDDPSAMDFGAVPVTGSCYISLAYNNLA